MRVFGDLTDSLPIGRPIGSVQINDAFQEEVEKRLNLINSEIKAGLSKYAAQDMTKKKFETLKIEFGKREQKLLKEVKIRVPGLVPDFKHANAKISQGRMIFTQ
jgi:hypothetical protein